MDVEKAKLVEMYRKLLELRKFEEKCWDLFSQNLIPGTIHLYLGQEAVAVGVCSNLNEDDYVQSTHRGHGHCLAKGAQMDKMFAELMGKATGYCKGKGGSMHITDANVGLLGACGVVGSGIVMAPGAGLSAKLRGTNQVVVCFFGDGASNTGNFHEGINIAAAWDLPVVFVCENNLYAMGTKQTDVMKVKNIADRASAYGIPGVICDGNDAVDVYKKAYEAVTRAREGKGPTLIECKTYRHRGHSRFDQGKYRPEEEVDEWLRMDPIIRMRERLTSMGILTEEEADVIVNEVDEEIEVAAKFALESPFPDPKTASEDVWVEERELE
ncbi:thiamine pyrophosphate-dependent dehydrogenase E1 component subunit alpha [Candidatus Borrarchaeum sp.]|uniref:thiamine pyrophosphate-dependent dehydrogenase E1 component subunit alpha n=1 Tax=Candidatus Borrarchaeum sp. TaxID=2846742 RepID=UPI00257F994F|nr:thiamine pyrophosphate-dependent dehydrogenase E1 component subunit alpha [Candidatus Borrarchaeum sp.]